MSPTANKVVVDADVVITLVESAVALIPIEDGMAPTHWATLLTRALPDWINRAIY